MIKKGFLLVGLIITTATLSSCIDKDYDLEDIDKTIAIGSSDQVFWMPKSSTDDIELGDFIELEDGDYIQIEKDENGEEFYCIKASGTDVINVTIPAYAPVGSVLSFTMTASSPIDLTSKPSSLDELRLDLLNPMLLLDIENDAPVNVDCKMRFDCKTNGALEPEGIDLEDIKAPNNSTTHFCFSDTKVTSPWQYENTNYEWAQSTNLHNKVMNLPDEVQLIMETITLTNTATTTTEIKKDINATFTLYSPLKAGPNFVITNESNEDGLYNELEMDDDTDINIKAICLEADIENKMPIDLQLEASAIDDNNNPIDNIKVLQTQKAEAGKSTKVNLTLETKDGTAFTKYLKKDATQKLDGVKLIIKATGNATSSAEPLRPTHKIKVKNMRLGIMGGVTFIND